MSMKRDSNVITVDFNARKAVNTKQKPELKAESASVGDMIMDALNGPEECPEDLTPREKKDRLKEDLEHILRSNEFNK